MSNMNDVIGKLKDELSFSRKLIKEIKSEQIVTDNQNQIELLRNEKRLLNERLVEMQSTQAQLLTQIEKMKKYESLFQSLKFVEVNGTLYHILNKIGKGGFSEVFSCVDFRELKVCALKKVTLNGLEPESFRQVMNEIDLLKRLRSNEKVIQLYDYKYFESTKSLYLIMELGSTDLNVLFKKEIATYGCVQEPTRVYYWKKMLEAVKAIHEQGIIHSDLKPSNFLLVGSQVKLIDFNISNTINNDRTSITLNSECGTLNYMAPESLQDKSDSKKKVRSEYLFIVIYMSI
jgi:serine/threonine protein kinase